jgi:hypothetical protein
MASTRTVQRVGAKGLNVRKFEDWPTATSLNYIMMALQIWLDYVQDVTGLSTVDMPIALYVHCGPHSVNLVIAPVVLIACW